MKRGLRNRFLEIKSLRNLILEKIKFKKEVYLPRKIFEKRNFKNNSEYSVLANIRPNFRFDRLLKIFFFSKKNDFTDYTEYLFFWDIG